MFTQLIAAGMNDSEFRLFLKNKAVEQFDGDYDILVASSLDNKINSTLLKSSDITLREYFEFLINTSNLKSTNSGLDLSFIDSLIIKYPLLQISIPEISDSSTENWDAIKMIPLVTFLPDDYNEDYTQQLLAYDVYGNEHYISATEEPSCPVIVISQNERLEIDNDIPQSSFNSVYFRNNYFTYIIPSVIEDNNNELIDLNLKSTNSNYDRDLNTGRDVLWKGRFVNKSAFRRVEGWPAGKPEFTVIIAYIDRSSGTPTAASLTKILSDGGWIKRYVVKTELKTKTINVPIMSWLKERYGSDMKYTWIEKDKNGSGSVEVNTVVTTKYEDNTTITSTVKCTIDDNDEQAGEAIVQYEDNADGDGTEYSTGIVRFWVKQE